MPPVVDELVPQRVEACGGRDAPACGVGVDRAGGGAVAEVVEGGTFPRVVLPAVGVQRDGVEAVDEAAEGAAGADLWQLVVVADEHELRARSGGVTREAG